jgi:hypothetical protein
MDDLIKFILHKKKKIHGAITEIPNRESVLALFAFDMQGTVADLNILNGVNIFHLFLNYMLLYK